MTLRTRVRTVALKRAQKIAEQLERFWSKLRWDNIDIPGKRFLKNPETVDYHPSITTVNTVDDRGGDNGVDHDSDGCPTLNQARDVYKRLKGDGKTKLFHQTTDRAIRYAVKILGDKPLSEYRKIDATRFRDGLACQGMSSATVRRVVAVVRSVINFTITEHGLDINNPFVGLYLGEKSTVNKRLPIPENSRLHIQRRCVEMDDEARWLIAMISDTGMRLSEAAGLHVNDIVLDHDIPHVIVRPHPWRRIKNNGSERMIPLVGASLWAACRIRGSSDAYAFPRYCDGKTTKSNSASAALNKWICAVECLSDIVDQIGGWTTAGVGQSYGQGYPLNILSKWMNSL